jgi:hypothetical protein|tara:strand:- start:990 stop:1397 length:408 start_codon:yes stop_codon:yes gene_type:complete
MTEIVCDNIKHKKILDKYIHSVKAAIYYITEDETVGKFGNFNDVLDMIISYSNEFREDHKHQDSLMLEWRYMIPNLVVFSAVGFLAGIDRDYLRKDISRMKKNLFRKTSQIIGETYDIYAEDRINSEFKVKLKEI